MSFRQGTNVEFEGPSFVENGSQPGTGPAGVPDNRDFSNPMYDMSGGPPSAAGQPAAGSAVLTPSSVSTHVDPASPAPVSTEAVRPRELSPVSIDTGKDTQCLVEDDSEC